MALQDISSISQTHWEIDPKNTTIAFDMGIPVLHRVKGRFHGVRGWVMTSGDNLGDAMVHVNIDASTIDTRLKVRDGHLHRDLFLWTDRFPTISFTSTRVTESGEGTLRVAGDLTIRGITKPVTLDAVVEQRDGGMAVIAASTVLDRRDFGIGPKLMSVTTGNKVAVQITLALRAS